MTYIQTYGQNILKSVRRVQAFRCSKRQTALWRTLSPEGTTLNPECIRGAWQRNRFLIYVCWDVISGDHRSTLTKQSAAGLHRAFTQLNEPPNSFFNQNLILIREGLKYHRCAVINCAAPQPDASKPKIAMVTMTNDRGRGGGRVALTRYPSNTKASSSVPSSRSGLQSGLAQPTRMSPPVTASNSKYHLPVRTA